MALEVSFEISRLLLRSECNCRFDPPGKVFRSVRYLPRVVCSEASFEVVGPAGVVAFWIIPGGQDEDVGVLGRALLPRGSVGGDPILLRK